MLVCSVLPRLTFVFYCILQAERQTLLLEELRKRAKEAVAKRVEKRVERYKNKLKQQLPSQISLWSAREDRLLKIISKKAGVSIAALLIRQCPNPPCEVDPDTDDETKTVDENIKVSDITDNNHDPTIRAWTASDKGYSRLPACLSACVRVCPILPLPFPRLSNSHHTFVCSCGCRVRDI